MRTRPLSDLPFEPKNKDLSHSSIDAYLKALSSASPTPGGGAAAALSLSQSCALYSMALRISFPDPDHFLTDPITNTVAPDQPTSIKLQTLLAKLEHNRDLFSTYANQDILIFEGIMSAYKLPRSTEQEKNTRYGAIESRLQDGLNLCVEMFQLAYETTLLGSFAVFHAKPSIISDSAIATELLFAGAESCFYNALINLKSLKSASKATSAPPHSMPPKLLELRIKIRDHYELFKEHCLKVLQIPA